VLIKDSLIGATYLPDASLTAQGVVELATIAETDTGTSVIIALTPAGLAGSALQTKVDGIEALADVTSTSETSHADVVVDGDFTANGFLKRTALGVYTVDTSTYETTDATILRQADVDDTPVNGVLTAPISSNWAFDHDIANNHLDWTADQGGTNIHAGNYTDTVYSHPNHTGDVTSTGDGATVIGANKVTLAMMATMATSSILGRITAATGNVEVLTAANVRTIINVADGADVTSTNETSHADVVVDADIGVNVQAYSATNALTSDITYEQLNTNGDVGTTAGTLAIGNHTHLLAAGATDVTATVAEVNLLDLSGLTAGWVLSADTATTASWKAASGAGEWTVSGTDLLQVTAGITDVYMTDAITDATPLAQTLHAQGGSGTDIAGADLTIAGGIGTGTGTGGEIHFQTAAAGATSSTPNTLTDALIIYDDGNYMFGNSTMPAHGVFTHNIQIGDSASISNEYASFLPYLLIGSNVYHDVSEVPRLMVDGYATQIRMEGGRFRVSVSDSGSELADAAVSFTEALYMTYNTANFTTNTLNLSGSNSEYRKLSLGSRAYLTFREDPAPSPSTGRIFSITGNAKYDDVTDDRWEYAWGTGGATKYGMANGEHTFSVAASGVAPNAITWTDALTIDIGGHVILPSVNDAVTPTIAFGDGNTGFYESADNQLSVSVAGVQRWLFSGSQFLGAASGSPVLLNLAATSAVPTLIPNNTDGNTGIGWASADNLSLITGGKEMLRLVETGTAGTDQIIISPAGGGMGAAATPSLAFGTGADTGFYESSNIINISNAGGNTYQITASALYGVSTGSGRIANATGSATVPTIMFNGDNDTGLGRGAADQFSLIAGGVEQLKVTTSGIFIGKGETIVPDPNISSLFDVLMLSPTTGFYSGDNLDIGQSFNMTQNAIRGSTGAERVVHDTATRYRQDDGQHEWSVAAATTPIVATSCVASTIYIIVTLGTTDFTAIGAATNTVGVKFTASGAGTGTGTAAPAAISFTDALIIDNFSNTYIGGSMITRATGSQGVMHIGDATVSPAANPAGGITFYSVSGGAKIRGTAGTLTFPNASDTIVGRATTDTLTNKTIDTTTNTVLATAITDGYVLTADGANGTAWEAAAGGGLGNIVEDVTPQLGAALDMNTFAINGSNAAGPSIVDEAATGSNPTLIPNKADIDTGVAWSVADTLSLVAGGVELLHLVETGVATTDQVVISPGAIRGSAAKPALAFGDRDTGFYESADDVLHVAINGSSEYSFQAAYLRTTTVGGPAMMNEAPSATNPVFCPASNDSDTGIGHAAANELSLITTAVERINISATGVVKHTADITPAVNNTLDLGSTSLKYANVWATTFEGEATTAQYADLAEMYTSDEEIVPGTVVCFGGTAEVTTCGTDADTRVAGIVSTNPAYLMNSALDGVAVALRGRVPCKVSGSIKKGDMLVSDGDGGARAEANPSLGTVLAKALEDSEGDAVIEVVV